VANTLSVGTIGGSIYTIRGVKVMLDRDLAVLYGVQTKALNQAVKRNVKRFPEEFMFQLTQEEAVASRSQFVTLKRGQNIKYLPFAFTEHGVAMLSSVLNSEKAIEINIAIIKAFIRLRELAADHTELRLVIEKLERRVDKHDMQIQVAFKSLKSLLDRAVPRLDRSEYSLDGKKKIGFVPGKK
jgi:phage regulator Rha-like protein